MAKTILLADDSVMIQKVIELTFIGEDFEVDSVSSGDDALKKLDGGAPDVVIADVHMHGSASGYQVARRSKELYPHVPVLLLVGSFEPFDQNEYQACGADRFLKKPFESEELERLVEELVAGAEAEARSQDLAPELPLAVAPDGFAPTLVSPDPVHWTGGSGDDVPEEEPGEPAPHPGVPVEDFGMAAETPTQSTQGEASLDLSDFESEPPPAPAPVSQGRDFRLDLDDEEDLSSSVAYDATPEEDTAVSFEEIAVEESSYGEVEIEMEDSGEPPLELASVDEDEAQEVASPDEDGGEEELPVAGFRLSDEDIDRIASRVAELVGERLVKDVAWEVIPDLAEGIIKDRLRELESQIE